ncbi:hypothetical protein QOZ80_7BG0606630 [Eleusine coracana subsp. coracana]|nr:hypothetical protein QOZ80_7BG0606630 [Eleusine coracana subsp. coracana]
MDAPVVVAASAAAAAAGGKMAEDTDRLLNSVRNYAFLLYGSTLAFGIAPRLAYKLDPRATPSATSNCCDAAVTAAVFTVATVLLHHILARVLERKTKAAPRLTPLFAWPLALSTWVCNTVFFLAYLGLGGAALVGRTDWAAVAVASAVNLAMAVRTVAGHLA